MARMIDISGLGAAAVADTEGNIHATGSCLPCLLYRNSPLAALAQQPVQAVLHCRCCFRVRPQVTCGQACEEAVGIWAKQDDIQLCRGILYQQLEGVGPAAAAGVCGQSVSQAGRQAGK